MCNVLFDITTREAFVLEIVEKRFRSHEQIGGRES